MTNGEAPALCPGQAQVIEGSYWEDNSDEFRKKKYIADIYFPARPGQCSVFFWQAEASAPVFSGRPQQVHKFFLARPGQR